MCFATIKTSIDAVRYVNLHVKKHKYVKSVVRKANSFPKIKVTFKSRPLKKINLPKRRQKVLV